MLPFLLFVFGFIVCVGMYIADHRRVLAKMEERYRSENNERRRTVVLGFFLCMLFTSLLSGCALENTAPPTPTAGPQISGKAMGGQQSITGSRIYLMKADTTGYGNAATDILTAGDGSDSIGYYVLTGTGGAFTLGSYTCTQNDQVYLLSLQGNPGLTNGTNNSHLAIMAMLGACPAAGNFVTSTPFVTINEITTIAAAYAMGGFMSSPTQMSSSSANASVGLANAALVAASLANIAAGATYTSGTTPNGNGTYSVNKVNTLADIIASCVNTDGSTTTGAACATLFTNAVNGSTQPTDTITAALNMVHFSSQNVSTLLGLAPGTAPFQPTLSPAPLDLSLSIAYASVDSSASNSYPTRIDNLGNIYKPDGASKPNGTTRAVNPLGAVVATYNTSTIEDQPSGGYIDPNNQNLWVPSGNTTKITAYNTTSHSAVTGSGFVDGSYSDGLAFDNSNNVYSVTNGCALVKGLNASPFTATSYTLTGACSSNSGFGYLAITSGSTIWVAQGNTSWTVSTTTTAAPGTSTNITTNSVGATGYKESGVVIDSSQNAWVVAYDSSTKANQLAAWDSTQTPLTNSPWAPSVTLSGSAVAIGALSIDGANLLWGTTNYGPVSILTSSPGSPLTKIANTSYGQGQCIPDQSGNVWCDILKGLILYPGIATPTANPVSISNHGTKP